jgi:hypothetical protein
MRALPASCTIALIVEVLWSIAADAPTMPSLPTIAVSTISPPRQHQNERNDLARWKINVIDFVSGLEQDFRLPKLYGLQVRLERG